MARPSFSVLAHTFVAATIFAGCAGVPAIQTVQFQVDKDDLDDPLIDAKLDDVIAALDRDPDLRLMVVGHADEDNTDEYNLALSQRRAECVRARLIERAPKYASRVETTGRGEWDRLGDGVSEPEKAQNRRVEVVVV